jgi:hypothetical protein
MLSVDALITTAAEKGRLARVVLPLVVEDAVVKAEYPEGVFTEVYLMVRTIESQGFSVNTHNTLAGTEESVIILEIEW